MFGKRETWKRDKSRRFSRLLLSRSPKSLRASDTVLFVVVLKGSSRKANPARKRSREFAFDCSATYQIDEIKYRDVCYIPRFRFTQAPENYWLRRSENVCETIRRSWAVEKIKITILPVLVNARVTSWHFRRKRKFETLPVRSHPMMMTNVERTIVLLKTLWVRPNNVL